MSGIYSPEYRWNGGGMFVECWKRNNTFLFENACFCSLPTFHQHSSNITETFQKHSRWNVLKVNTCLFRFRHSTQTFHLECFWNGYGQFLECLWNVGGMLMKIHLKSALKSEMSIEMYENTMFGSPNRDELSPKISPEFCENLIRILMKFTKIS